MRAAYFAPLLLVLATCGGDGNGISDPDDDGALGSFEVEFSGALTGSYEGAATFASAPGSGFAIVLVGTGGSASATVVREVSGRPGTGTHPIADATGNTPDMTDFWLAGSAGGQAFAASSGSMTISTSSQQRLAGTIQFTAMSAAGQVTGQVTFNARCTVVVTGSCD